MLYSVGVEAIVILGDALFFLVTSKRVLLFLFTYVKTCLMEIATQWLDLRNTAVNRKVVQAALREID